MSPESFHADILRILKSLNLGCYFRRTGHVIRLRALRALDDVELYIVTLLQALIAFQLDGTVVHEDIRAIVASDKPIALRIVEPLHLAFILCHVRTLPFLTPGLNPAPSAEPSLLNQT